MHFAFISAASPDSLPSFKSCFSQAILSVLAGLELSSGLKFWVFGGHIKTLMWHWSSWLKPQRSFDPELERVNSSASESAGIPSGLAVRAASLPSPANIWPGTGCLKWDGQSAFNQAIQVFLSDSKTSSNRALPAEVVLDEWRHPEPTQALWKAKISQCWQAQTHEESWQ